ncbi:hypothetical protein CVT24_005338 [Panaeolus cyanescens]|uniref:GDP-fucose protein O-fucosyltransferase n=1 Tax=Panaeolus cyanescens TaxID=181874 RepID=A0A409Y920_9AGAR|nr:hypothetical protein CVT24_005338 [Panaeolus cyanescens]
MAWRTTTTPALESFEEVNNPSDLSQVPLYEPSPFDSEHYLKGEPTDNFRDNLRPDVNYITSWVSAGWTNDVMTYINLIYLGLLTNRVPVIPFFTPSHIGSQVPPIDFSEVFDMKRLRRDLRRPILEWHEVKKRNSTSLDDLGCWDVWRAVQDRDNNARYSPTPDLLRLDISYSKAPSWIKIIPAYEHDQHSSFAALSTLAFPEGRAEYGGDPLASPIRKLKLPPDDQMLCYDYLYYVCANQPFEFEFEFSPAWLHVGQFMRWTPRLQGIANEYVRKAFGVEPHQETPEYIAIHIRHGDFANWCGDVPVSDCFAPLSVIARRVDEVKHDILERKGITINHVIMTSDERNTTWWDEVTARGWYGIDHSKTKELYGDWYPVLIDATIQSSGLGFVGTDRSTMSVLARRRVQSWRNGVTRTVKWGRPNSDDH